MYKEYVYDLAGTCVLSVCWLCILCVCCRTRICMIVLQWNSLAYVCVAQETAEFNSLITIIFFKVNDTVRTYTIRVCDLLYDGAVTVNHLLGHLYTAQGMWKAVVWLIPGWWFTNCKKRKVGERSQRHHRKRTRNLLTCRGNCCKLNGGGTRLGGFLVGVGWGRQRLLRSEHV